MIKTENPDPNPRSSPPLDSVVADPLHLFGALPLLRLRMEYQVNDPELLPDYLGSSWRGVIGWQMKSLCCPFEGRGPCRQCLIREHCPYFVLYELQSDLPGFQDAPRPYVFFPEKGLDDSRQSLIITLAGQAVRGAPLLCKTIQEANRTGLGRERVRFKVRDWWEERPGTGWVRLAGEEISEQLGSGHLLADSIPPAPDLPWRVRLVTPLRLRARGRNVVAMDWPTLLAALVKRLEMLAAIFGQGRPLGKDLWQALVRGFEASPPHTIDERIAWKDWSRYSSRQARKVPMGGLVGETVIKDAAPEVWQWLKIAEVIHVGKGAGMGLGKIEVTHADQP